MTISHTIIPSRTRITLSRTRLPPSRTRITPSRTRFQSRSGWGFYCKCSKIDWMSMNEENSRASIRAREAEKSHSIRTFLQARGAKKKDPNCIQIRVLLWCRKWDSALRVRSACAPRSACAAAALPGPYKSPTGAFAIRGFESLIAKQKPPPWGGLCFGAGSGTRTHTGD